MLTKEKLAQLLFPHEEIRKIQDNLIVDVENAIKSKRCIIMHAPTGLGKTASTLPIALAHAIENDLKVFFLTSRHTQHKIAIDTLRVIKKKYDKDFVVADMIGKRWMCAQPGSSILPSAEFHNYCKSLVEDKKCEFYNNTYTQKHQPSITSKKIIDDLTLLSPVETEKLISITTEKKLCPYEIALKLSSKARVIITDYNYVFNPNIQESFFKKIGVNIEESIIIVDEAHNLPLRIRDSMTEKISTYTLKRAIKEAKDFQYTETSFILEKILELLETLAIGEDEEKLIAKDKFISLVDAIEDYNKIIADLTFLGKELDEQQKQNSIVTVARFLELWQGEDKGFARILSKKESNNKKIVTLSYRCLDPSLITSEIFPQAYSSILMSGTLTPTDMFADILGLPKDHIEKAYSNPFPEDNKLSIIVPETTTKFTARNAEQYSKISDIVGKIVNTVPGNTIVFFPSYVLRENIFQFFNKICDKPIIKEEPNLNKDQKESILKEFKRNKNHGSVLLAISSGSFSEGIDLPGDLLKCVVVVGLPLNKPDLETKELISYYDEKFGKGWDYGYILPAISKCKQSAGRCIRSETDRGVVVYLDQRYAWNNYFRCFSDESNLFVTKDYMEKINYFFGKLS